MSDDYIVLGQVPPHLQQTVAEKFKQQFRKTPFFFQPLAGTDLIAVLGKRRWQPGMRRLMSALISGLARRSRAESN